jgi:energy-coupling factor transport system ATP-binding protein
VLDEPTSELDPMGTAEVFRVLKQLNEEYQLTIIVVEQKINILLEYIRRLVVMDAGQVVADRSPRAIIGQPDILSRIGLRVPPVSELAYLLQQEGLYRDRLPLTVDEAYLGLSRVLEVKHD